IVVRPELLLFSRTLSRFSSLLGLRVDIAQREIPEDESDFALVCCHEPLQGVLGLAAVGALKIGKFDDRDWRTGWPQGRLALSCDLHRRGTQGHGHRVTRLEVLQECLAEALLWLLVQVRGDLLGDLLKRLLDTAFIGLIERLHLLRSHGLNFGTNLIVNKLLHRYATWGCRQAEDLVGNQIIELLS